MFDITEPHLVVPWLEAIEGIFMKNGITQDDAKLSLALEYSAFGTREVLRNLPGVAALNYDRFKEDLRALFPGIIDDGRGSLTTLHNLIAYMEPIGVEDKGKFRLFDIQFEAESKKLMSSPALLSNRDAVRLYLMPFTEHARRIVFEKASKAALSHNVSVGATSLPRREDDPIMINEIRETAQRVFKTSNLESIYGLGVPAHGRIGSINPLGYRREPISLPFASGIPRTDPSYLRDFRKIKQEEGYAEGTMQHTWGTHSRNDREKLELERERLANQKDVNEAFMKELREMTSKFGESLGAVSSLVGAITRKTPQTEAPQRERYANSSRELLCFMCRAKDHFVSNCPHYQGFVKKGWLVPEGNGSNRMKLRDEIRMPREDPNVPRYKLIEQIATDRGWNKAESFFANIEDEAEDELNMGLQAGDQVTILMNQLVKAREELENSNQLRLEEMKRFAERTRIGDESITKNC